MCFICYECIFPYLSHVHAFDLDPGLKLEGNEELLFHIRKKTFITYIYDSLYLSPGEDVMFAVFELLCMLFFTLAKGTLAVAQKAIT